MALSNIFREPRREITETLVGVLVAGAAVFGYIKLAYWIASFHPGPARGDDFLVGLLIPLALVVGVLFTILVGMLVALVIHGIGERTCNKLQKHGIHLRPRRRY